MEFIKLFTTEKDRAVSPVIGVILMVAITVILAAVIGTFVLGLGDQVQETSPNAQFNWDQKSSDELDLTHESGGAIDPSNLEVVNSDATLDSSCNADTEWGSGVSEVTAGDTCNVHDGSGNTVTGTYRLVWTSSSGDQSNTISRYEA